MRRAIDQLAALVGYIANNLKRPSHRPSPLTTASSSRKPPRVETDKSKLEDTPDHTILTKKRYILGTRLPDHEAVWHGTLSMTAGADGDMEFWIPKGANLFHFVGGARFAHGGPCRRKSSSRLSR